MNELERPDWGLFNRWLCTTGDDGDPHVLYRPERRLHRLTLECPCNPRVESGVVIHTVLTPASRCASTDH